MLKKKTNSETIENNNLNWLVRNLKDAKAQKEFYRKSF